MIKTLSAHFFTCRSGWRSPPFPDREELHEVIEDPERGDVPLRGHLYRASHKLASARSLIILVHGLSSQPDSPYLSPYVLQGLKEGWDVISLALRGSIGEGVDHYHAGLTDDLYALIASERVAPYHELLIIGFSLGGHVALRYACRGADPRVSAVASICPPIDLRLTQQRLDQRVNYLYRRHLLSSLKRAYRMIWENATRAGTPLPSDLHEVLACRSIYDWDRLVVVPRFGFDSVEEYHREVSLSAVSLRQARVPCLLLFARHDPLISFSQLSPTLSNSGAHMKVLTRGGHLSFPAVVDLEVGLEPSPLPAQLLAWMRQVNA